MINNFVTRRAVLAGLAGLACTSAVGGLSGCGGKGVSVARNNAEQNTKVVLPDYLEFKGAKPDLPGTADGVEPAWLMYPADRPKSVSAPVGSGGAAITGLASIWGAIPPAASSNAWWGDLNKRLGIPVELQMVPGSDYSQRFATTIAGNQLPDLVQMQDVENLPRLLDSQFTRLDQFLSGAAIKDYPNLANIPTRNWKATVYNGGIFGVPVPRGTQWSYVYVRQDLFDKYGVSSEPKDFEEFKAMCAKLSNPAERRWAFAAPNHAWQVLQRMNDEPNEWKADGGKLTHAYETEQYAQSVADLQQMWKSGFLHPDAFVSSQPFKQLFNSGQVAIAVDGYTGWAQFVSDNASNPAFTMGLMTIPKREGGGLAKWHYNRGYYSITAIKKQSDPERVKLLLRVLNYLAAPFGTEEYHFLKFGVEGRDHTMTSTGDPIKTKEGSTNLGVPVKYLADAPNATYQPGRPDDVKLQHAYQSKVLPGGKTNPVLGLFSNAAATKGASAKSKFDSAINEIIQGRRQIGDLKDVVAKWREAAGDEMRREYESQLGKS